MAVTDSVVRRRRLASELRRLRSHAGLTADEVAEKLGWSASKVSRIETHRIQVKPADLNQLLDLYQVSEVHREQLATLAQWTRRKGWWEAYADSLPEEITTFIALEDEAVAVMERAMDAIPGLLQTPDYARAVLQVLPTTVVPPRQLERAVEVRMRRQERLAGSKPVRLIVTADEAVLLRRFGTPDVMRAQLEHLIQASHQPSVTLRVLPLATAHPVGFGHFQILEFEAFAGDLPTISDVVSVEQLSGMHVYDDETVAYQHRLSFNQAMAVSLEPEPSRELIARIMRDHWS